MRRVFSMSFDAPPPVFASPVDDATLDLSGWTGDDVPAPVMLRWLEQQPISSWTMALLEDLAPTDLPETDRPRLLALLDRAESHVAARKARVIAALPRDLRRARAR